MKKIILNIFILILINSASVSAAGSKSAEFILFGVGARPLALSGAYTAVAGDIYSVQWNPAGLADIKNFRTAAMHTKLPESISQQFIALGIPLAKKTKNQYLGISLNFVNYGNEMITMYVNPDDQNYFTKAQTGFTFDGSDLLAKLTYAYRENNKLSLGFNMKYISQNIFTYSGAALGVDAGFIYNISNNTNLGAGIYNIGTKLKLYKESAALPMHIKSGISTNIIEDIFLLNGDIIYTFDEDFDYAFGVEFKPVKIFALRGGYNSINEAGNGLTLGFGLNFNAINLDYAYEFFGDFDASHKFSIDYAFGDKHTADKDKPIVIKNRKSVEQMIKEGYLFILDGDYFNALFTFTDALRIDGSNITARLWLAYTHTKLGNLKTAKEEYNQVLYLQPGNQNAAAALRMLK